MVLRLFSAAVAGCAFLFLSGCSATAETATPQPSAQPSTQDTASSAPSPTAAITLVDKATTCAAFNKTTDRLADTAVELGRKILQAEKGSAALATAVGDVHKMYATTQAELEQHAAAAKDPQVKTAIGDYAAELKKSVAVAVAAGLDADKTREAFSGADLLNAQRKAIELCE